MLDSKIIQQVAAELEQSEQTGQQIKQVSLRYPNMSIDDSYAIQSAWVNHKLQTGRSVRGHKVGLTSRAMQLSSNIDEPDFGVLLDDMFYQDGQPLPAQRFIVPRVEVELAFILKHDLVGPNISLSDVLLATDYVVPALEIIDARFHQIDPETGKTRTVFDTIADNAANAAVMLGGRPVRPDAVDLRWMGSGLMRNGIIEETGLALGVLNHPGNGVAWLANKLALVGSGLERGQVVLSGSFTRPVTAQAGDVFYADYGPLGTINCRFI
ncbi:2-oxo-hept-4-ene-1,7-dioate hydratase [Alcaligenes endophyticus]|uniref:2-oxo-hepta-3-ene-1,7-dioic acid hydratase n=1 Tax=Alcaligenes endophyticus TaxID=1929088 RepID=A0ABT8EMD1_9BURK|nr:2-oxo-hepta-3-ene-1,7-dioic acid hydratase [Alcaligenes endophyticus]MCX5591010.1 2-oxo-hepta-3-ene-1,7-dioic acid hydratase [Alcaligenes endophyticus]MDN4122413.1 2-oxo-hepta-3-ene-1,7-dioic acid hydratase [Alcaligenes endophyticus]